MNIKTNLVSGIFFVCISLILLFLMPSQIQVYSTVSFLESAKAAPLIAILIMLICGLLLIFQSLVLKKENIVVLQFKEQKYAIYTILFMILFAALIYLLGFLIASIVTVLGLYKFYGIKSKKQLISLLLIAVFVYFVFINVFHISLPGIGGVVL